MTIKIVNKLSFFFYYICLDRFKFNQPNEIERYISGFKCLVITLSFHRNQGCNYPFKGGKDTFWEGGVRGVGFVHSKLIRKKGRVSYDLIDVTDWLPTFYHLAGGDVTKIQERIDGMNVWETIADGKKSPRTEVRYRLTTVTFL